MQIVLHLQDCRYLTFSSQLTKVKYKFCFSWPSYVWKWTFFFSQLFHIADLYLLELGCDLDLVIFPCLFFFHAFGGPLKDHIFISMFWYASDMGALRKMKSWSNIVSFKAYCWKKKKVFSIFSLLFSNFLSTLRSKLWKLFEWPCCIYSAFRFFEFFQIRIFNLGFWSFLQ